MNNQIILSRSFLIGYIVHEFSRSCRSSVYCGTSLSYVTGKYDILCALIYMCACAHQHHVLIVLRSHRLPIVWSIPWLLSPTVRAHTQELTISLYRPINCPKRSMNCTRPSNQLGSASTRFKKEPSSLAIWLLFSSYSHLFCTSQEIIWQHMIVKEFVILYRFTCTCFCVFIIYDTNKSPQ